MVEADLGKATILYEAPDGETVEETVDNEHIAYFQDHWIVKTGEHEAGHDVIRRIPSERVYYVERNVEEFEREIRTLRDEIQSFADEVGLEVQTLRDRVGTVTDLPAELLGGTGRSSESESEPLEIDVADDEGDEEDDFDRGEEVDFTGNGDDEFTRNEGDEYAQDEDDGSARDEDEP